MTTTATRQVRTPVAPAINETEPYWRSQAACVGVDPEIFFPISTTGPVAERLEQEAKNVCRQCPAIDACLRWAIASGQDFGIAGGMSEKERRSLKRRVARAEAKQAAA
jgi:WhiB family transcriptional regulator, redox-sensing transcriptional regulator